MRSTPRLESSAKLNNERSSLSANILFLMDKHDFNFGPESQFAKNKKRHQDRNEEAKHLIQEYYDEPSDFEHSRLRPINAVSPEEKQVLHILHEEHN